MKCCQYNEHLHSQCTRDAKVLYIKNTEGPIPKLIYPFCLLHAAGKDPKACTPLEK